MPNAVTLFASRVIEAEGNGVDFHLYAVRLAKGLGPFFSCRKGDFI